jgi:hypothetical protein
MLFNLYKRFRKEQSVNQPMIDYLIESGYILDDNLEYYVVQKDGSKQWFKKGWTHRENGPAIERNDGGIEWYLEGSRYFNLNDYLEANHYISNDKKVLLKLTFSGLL